MLRERTAGLEESLKLLKAGRDAAGFEGRRRRLAEQEDLLRRFAEKRVLAEEKAGLEQAEAGIGAMRRERADAGRAELVRRPFEAFEAAERELGKRSAALEAAEKLLAEKTEALKAAALSAEEAGKRMPVADMLHASALKLEGLRSDFEGLDGLRAAEKKASGDLKKAQDGEKKAEARCAARTDELGRAYAALEQARTAHGAALEGYMANITGVLASRLEPGKPCPVCGSTHHDAPAVCGGGVASSAELERLDAEAKARQKEWNDADGMLKEAQGAHEAAKALSAECLVAWTQAKERLENTEKSIAGVCGSAAAAVPEGAAPGDAEAVARLNAAIAGISGLSGLEKVLAGMEDLRSGIAESAEACRAAEKRAEELRNDAASKRDSAEKEKTEALERKEKALSELADALRGSGFSAGGEGLDTEAAAAAKAALRDPGRLSALDRRIQEHETRCADNARKLADAEAGLEGCEEPDAEALKREKAGLDAEEKDFVTKIAAAEKELEGAGKKLESLSADLERYESERPQIEIDMGLAKAVRGDTGTGLHRYVLGVMFSSVIAAANRMLAGVHGGRYALYRSEAKVSGNKRGLELFVVDRNAGTPPEAGERGRSVNTLSGGEKFLVSLALSIGLSEVAQCSGRRLDAMFIDEGFGSLDENSINDAMDVLRSVQAASGLVGIISHVRVLADNIPNKIRVAKGSAEKGGSLSLSVG
ncbi:MAG: SMC family ATPase [Mailhella sp.]|nr:SMC family ATPase [Mailhella sp.]